MHIRSPRPKGCTTMTAPGGSSGHRRQGRDRGALRGGKDPLEPGEQPQRGQGLWSVTDGGARPLYWMGVFGPTPGVEPHGER